MAGLLLTTRLLLQLRGKESNSGGSESPKTDQSSRGDCPGKKSASTTSDFNEDRLRDETGSAQHLAGLALDLLTITPLRRSGLEGRQVAGRPTSTTDIYTWFLTNFCSWLATATPPQLRRVEENLLDLLLSGHSVPGCQTASDIWVFMARFGSPSLCMNYIDLFTAILQKLKPTAFSNPGSTFLPLLLSRLVNLLTPSERQAWRQKQDLVDSWLVVLVPALEAASGKPQLDQITSTPSLISFLHRSLPTSSTDPSAVKEDELVDNLWHKLASGNYKASQTFASTQGVQALAEFTKSTLLRKLSEEKVARLLFFMEKLAASGSAHSNLNLVIAGILRIVLKLHPNLASKSTRLLSAVTSAKASEPLVKPLLASVDLCPGSGADLSHGNTVVEEEMTKSPKKYGVDRIAAKIALQVGDEVEMEGGLLSSMEVDNSDEGVSQPMEELEVGDGKLRGCKRVSPSGAGSSLTGQKQDKVSGEKCSPDNKKSRYSAEEEVVIQSNLRKCMILAKCMFAGGETFVQAGA